MINERVVNMSGVKKDQGGVRRKEKQIEDEDEKADGGNWMIDRKNDVIFYESVLASGRFCKFFKLNWIGWSACVLTNFFQFLS